LNTLLALDARLRLGKPYEKVLAAAYALAVVGDNLLTNHIQRQGSTTKQAPVDEQFAMQRAPAEHRALKPVRVVSQSKALLANSQSRTR